MTILDTNAVIKRINKKEIITDNITVVTTVEYTPVLEYSKFIGEVFYPTLDDFILAVKLQKDLRQRGIAQGFADLVIAAICINKNEPLRSSDSDFKEIAKVSSLKLL